MENRKQLLSFCMELVFLLYLFFNTNQALSTPENFYKNFEEKTKEEKVEHCLYCLLKDWSPTPCKCKKEVCLNLLEEEDVQTTNKEMDKPAEIR